MPKCNHCGEQINMPTIRLEKGVTSASYAKAYEKAVAEATWFHGVNKHGWGDLNFIETVKTQPSE